jgi:hypothetical protein
MVADLADGRTRAESVNRPSPGGDRRGPHVPVPGDAARPAPVGDRGPEGEDGTWRCAFAVFLNLLVE